MTEFTSERIKKYREFLRSTNPEHSSHTVVASLALDEIERLQKEIELLQTNRKLLNRDLGKANNRIVELEQEHTWIPVSDAAVFELERGFYLYEDERGAHMIGLFNFTDRNLLGATKIYGMKLYPPHLKNIPQPTKE